MSSPTEEQAKAINTTGNNIIVSAGAGSGKTFVLKERVLKTVQEGVSVEDLIILTFTKNAASEMKDRIRKIISEHPELKSESEKVDSAYITTFDSFASSIVKKYNYLLNISKDFSIIDDNIVKIELTKILDEILDSYYKNPTEEFNHFINTNTVKNDTEIKKAILRLYSNLGNLLDKEKFLDEALEKYFSKDYINEKIDEYTNLVFEKLESIKPLCETLIDISPTEKSIEANQDYYNSIDSATTIEELKEVLDTKKLAVVQKQEDYKDLRGKIVEIEKEIKALILYSTNELKTNYLSTKTSVGVVINILKELNNRIKKFKENNNAYEFGDISRKAIELVSKHEEVREEIKQKVHEIMIDEYQDTDDIQETFINYIAKNNVYMVGDVKQSIYRFRNANPYLFKSKYDTFDGSKGIRIDLTRNFRSRKEVIENVNDLFEAIMTDAIGGANYKKEHITIAGSASSYDKSAMNDYDYNMEVLEYKLEDKTYKKEEVEAYIVAKDIKEKLDNKNLACHEKGGDKYLAPITYSDFAILVDVSTNFELLKKTLESFGIPSVIEKAVSVKEDEEILILKNLVNLLIHIKDNNLDIDFKHSYISIARSYIWNSSDEELFDLFIYNENIKETPLYKKMYELTSIVDSKSNKEIIKTLINEFDIVNKLKTFNNVDNRLMKLEYFVKESDSLDTFGLDIYGLIEYFNEILASDEKLEVKVKQVSSNAVTIMTIHGSKGLEYNYVYMPYLDGKFISNNDRPRYNVNDLYGFIFPFFNEGIDNTFIYDLNYEHERKEIISEKIRLFYVAITRAKEQFIMIHNKNEKIEPCSINEDIIKKCSSFGDIISYMSSFFSKYTKTIDISTLGIDDKKEANKTNYKELIPKSDKKIDIKDISIDNELIENKHFSKTINSIITKEEKKSLEYGTHLHYIFESFNFKNNNLDELNITDEEKGYIKNFLNHEETKNISNANTYKEHEILFTKDNNLYHGIIDLLVEYPTYFDIIDYKTSEVDEEAYLDQLKGYKNYIEETYNKPCNIYLYSIKKDLFKKI